MAGSSRPRRRRPASGKRPAKRKAKARPVGTSRPQASRAPKKVAARPKRRPHTANVVEIALAAFAHEVRTPLTGILAISSLLATSELGERERRWVDTIKAGAEHLAALATLFVDAARDGQSGLHIRHDFFDLRTLARAAGDSLAGRAAAKGLSAEVEIADTLPAFATGDPVRLRAALENLIDNAAKFTEYGGLALKVTSSAAGEDRVRVAFAVSDSGIGMTLADIRRLFRPFSQANVAIAARFGGAGLGLSSVRQLARAMGGDVAVTQRPQGGTTFTMTVTLGRARDDSAAPSGELVRPPGPLRVLSVEDNPFGRVVLNAILTELGHQAEFVGCGELALERVAQGGFDAVLMDMVLPGIGGIETIRRLRALPPPHGRIPIIGVSGKAEDEPPARAAGADAFLAKPVSPRALAAALFETTRRTAAPS